MPILVEAAVESLAEARLAVAAGAQRLELCANLAVGGTTPDLGILNEVLQWATVPVQVLVRPRGGNFVYTGDELTALLRDIALVREAGAHGIVTGALTSGGRIDLPATMQMLEAARPLRLTFHRAFDATPDHFRGLAELRELGVERVLTSGGAATAEAGIPVLAQLVTRAAGRIAIMAGGSVRANHARRIVEQTGVSELHLQAGPQATFLRKVVDALSH